MKTGNRELLTNRLKQFAFSEANLLMAVITFGILFRLAAIFLYPHVPGSDEKAYLDMATKLVAGETMKDEHGNYAFYSVGYSVFALAPVLALFNDSILALRIGNTILGAIGIGLVYAVAREAGANKQARLLSALLWALYLPSSVYGVYLAKENLHIPLILGLVWCALRMMRQFHVGIAVVCGVLCGLIALTGNSALSLVAAIGLALWLSKSGLRSRLAALPVMLLVGMLVVSPWLARNLAVLGAPVLNTNGGFNLYLGNNPAANGMFVSIADTPRAPTWEALRVQAGEIKASETLKQEALAWIAANPGAFSALAIKKLGLFWMPPIHDGAKGSGTVEKLIRFVWLIQFSILVVAAVGSLRYLRSRPSMAVLWMAVAAYSGVHMLFYVIFRYREPIMPVLCVLAAVMLAQAAARGAAFYRQRLTRLSAPSGRRAA